MRKTWVSPIAIVVTGIFTVASVLCCCLGMSQTHKTAKTSCCETKSAKTDHSSKSDCKTCNSTIKFSDNSKKFDLTPNIQVVAINIITRSYDLRPAIIAKPVFINGPPGPLSVVPLYIQQHTLRI